MLIERILQNELDTMKVLRNERYTDGLLKREKAGENLTNDE